MEDGRLRQQQRPPVVLAIAAAHAQGRRCKAAAMALPWQLCATVFWSAKVNRYCLGVAPGQSLEDEVGGVKFVRGDVRRGTSSRDPRQVTVEPLESLLMPMWEKSVHRGARHLDMVFAGLRSPARCHCRGKIRTCRCRRHRRGHRCRTHRRPGQCHLPPRTTSMSPSPVRVSFPAPP